MASKLACVVALLVLPTASFGQLKVIMSGGFAAAYQEILPEFESTTGITVTTLRGPSQGNGPDTIGAQLRRGAPADVVIISVEGLRELVAAGRIVAGTDVELARSPLGVSVRAGAAKPDISTVDALKKTLLRANSITCQSSPAIYLTTRLFPQLGIAEEMAGKVRSAGADAVARGDVEIAILPMSELIHAPGVDFVGTIPAEIQHPAVFAAAIVEGSKELQASKRLIAFLSSESVTTAIRRSGMEPSSRPR
jgi:molybdate transport system substrate-binding protein